MVGDALEVTITNTSTADVVVPSQVQTGLNIGGEWAFTDDGGSASGIRQHYGIGSSGLGYFGPGDLIGGANLSGPVNVNGLDWGLVFFGDAAATGNTGVTSEPLVVSEPWLPGIETPEPGAWSLLATGLAAMLFGKLRLFGRRDRA
jgi:hypothetical protein